VVLPHPILDSFEECRKCGEMCLTETSEWIDDLFLRDDNAEVDDFEVVDPLSAEREADVPTDEGGLPMWIDFVEMRDLVRELTGLESMDQLAQKIMGDGGGVSDIVDAFLRGSGILDDDGLLVVDPSVVFDSGSSSSFLEFQDMFTRTRLSVTSVSVGGLDSLVANGTSVLDPIGRYTLRNSLRFDRLAFALGVRAEMRPSSESSGAAAAANDIDDSPVVRENFTIGIGMRDVLVTFSLFLGANNGTLDGMPLGSIIDFENIMPCVAGALSSISSLYSMLYFLIYWNLTLIPTYVKATFLLIASMELFHRQILLRA
jgi:hypothetical protein